jgi:hypothetical protein
VTDEEAQQLLAELRYYAGHVPWDARMRWGDFTDASFADRLVTDAVLAEDVRETVSVLHKTANSERELFARQSLLLRRGIPKVLHPQLLGDKRLDHDTQAMQVVREWLSGDRWALVMVGQHGPGKSMAAAWAVAEYPQLPAGRPPYFLTLREAYEYNMYNGDADYLYEAPFLCVDELGRTYDDRKEFLRKKMETLLMSRYDRRLRTVITSNLPCNSKVNGIKEFVGEAVWDRIISSYRICEITEGSLRLGRKQ